MDGPLCGLQLGLLSCSQPPMCGTRLQFLDRLLPGDDRTVIVVVWSASSAWPQCTVQVEGGAH
jgi:hypothetical protein